MSGNIGASLLAIVPFIFFFSLLVGSLVYLLIRLRGSHKHHAKEISVKHAAMITAGLVVIICAFSLALACILVFEAFNVRWN